MLSRPFYTAVTIQHSFLPAIPDASVYPPTPKTPGLACHPEGVFFLLAEAIQKYAPIAR